MIIKCSFEFYQSFWTALSLVTEYEGHGVYFRMLHVAGSIRTCQKAAITLFERDGRGPKFDEIEQQSDDDEDDGDDGDVVME
eukprot:gene7871-9239_t